jgi:hypothetical protein
MAGSRKRKTNRPTHWAGVVVDDNDGSEEAFTVEVGKTPRIYVVAEFPPPGILSNKPPSEKSPQLELKLKSDREALKAFLTKWEQENLNLASIGIG